MRETVLSEGPVIDMFTKFVFAELYTDRNDVPQDVKNNKLLREQFGSVALPLYVTLGPDGRERSRLVGTATVAQFIDFLKKGLETKVGSK